MSGAGAALGLLLGGILTEYLNWRWVLFVNVPIGVAADRRRVLLPAPVRAAARAGSTSSARCSRSPAWSSLVYGFINAANTGWSNTDDHGRRWSPASCCWSRSCCARRTASDPMMPMRIFDNRNRCGAYLVMLVVGAAMFGMFYFLTFFVQGVMGFSALQGRRRVPAGQRVIIGIASQVVTRLMPRFGPKVLISIGTVLLTIALFCYSTVNADSTYLGKILPGMLILAVGMGCIFVPLTGVAVAKVRNTDAGSGLGPAERRPAGRWLDRAVGAGHGRGQGGAPARASPRRRHRPSLATRSAARSPSVQLRAPVELGAIGLSPAHRPRHRGRHEVHRGRTARSTRSQAHSAAHGLPDRRDHGRRSRSIVAVVVINVKKRRPARTGLRPSAIAPERRSTLEVAGLPPSQVRPAVARPVQHSMTLTARPPRAVSLYLTFMSAPVSRIVLITLSRLTMCRAVAAQRDAGGVDRLDRRHRVALDARHLHQPARPGRRSARGCAPCRSRRRSRPDPGVPPMHLAQRAGGHRAGRADLALAAHLGAGDRRVLLVEHADRAGGEQEPDHAVVATPRARSACSSAARPGSTPAAPLVGAVTTRPPAAFSSFTASANRSTQSITRSGSVRELLAAQAPIQLGRPPRHLQPAGQRALVAVAVAGRTAA